MFHTQYHQKYTSFNKRYFRRNLSHSNLKVRCMLLHKPALDSKAQILMLLFGFFISSESTRFLDVYLFLFDDFLLITKMKRNKKVRMGRNVHIYCMCRALLLFCVAWRTFVKIYWKVYFLKSVNTKRFLIAIE